MKCVRGFNYTVRLSLPFSPSSSPTTPQYSNGTAPSSTWSPRTASSLARILQNVIRLQGRRRSHEKRLYLSLTPCTLLCTVPWVSANNVVVKQSPRRDPPRLRMQTSMRERYRVARVRMYARNYHLCIPSSRCAAWINGNLWALWNKSDFHPWRSPRESSASGHGEAVISRRLDFLVIQKNTRYVTLTFSPVILHPVSKVTITPMYNSYLNNNVARSCDLYGVACFLVFAFNYARNAVLHCTRLFAR